jgi:hypothetical protein
VTILEDHERNLWFGTITGGVARYDGSRWTAVTTVEGLSNNIVWDMTEDRVGSLWFATSGGASRLEPDVVSPRTVFLGPPPNVSGSANQSISFEAAFGETRIEFSTRFDSGPWSPWSVTNNWTQAGLFDGSHLLEVRSRDIWNNVEQRPAAAHFEIDATPPRPS